MEELNQEIPKIVIGSNEIKFRSLKDDPQYFAAYLNMARHNVFMIVNHITEKLNIPDFKRLSDDSEIEKKELNILLNVFDQNSKYFDENKDGAFQYLKRFMPMVKVFSEEDSPRKKGKKEDTALHLKANIDFKKLHNFLSVSFSEICRFRDSYTHYFAFDESGEIKEKKITLDEKIIDDINLLFKQAPEYSYFNFDTTQTQEDFKHLKNYKLFDENHLTKFTPDGFYFFICLFLEKAYAYKFLKRFKYFKNENTSVFRGTLQAFTAYIIKLPHEKLISEDPKQSLLLDMLNELNRCPLDLYKHLTDKDKEEFQPKLETKALENFFSNSAGDITDDETLNKLLTDATSLKRKTSRFSYFALRYLEETNCLDKISFQVGLGKLFMRAYPKSIIGIESNRKIQKEVHAFGKLSLFPEMDKALTEITANADGIFFEQYAPHYNIVNNKIGFLLNNGATYYPKYENAKIAQIAPTAFLSVHELPKVALLEILDKGAVQLIIVDYISILQSDLYIKDKLDDLIKDITYEPETFSRRIENNYKPQQTPEEKQKRKEYSAFLKARAEMLDKALGGKIKANQLPGRIKDLLMRMEDASLAKRIHMKVTSLKKEVKEQKYKLSKGNAPKIGEMATFIARDIINMIIDKDLKNRITSAYYNKLQNKIAYFGLDRESVFQLCNELKIFDKQKGHPFLEAQLITNSKNVLEFYQSYIETKQKWIIKTFEKKENRKTVYYIPENGVPYTLRKLKDNSYNFENWLKEKVKMPIDLPTNLFDDKIVQVLKSRINGTMQINPKDKFAMLLSYYLGNDTQPFYSYVRKYFVKPKMKKGKPSRNKKEEKIEKQELEFVIGNLNSGELKKKYDKNVEETEKLIRFELTKDRITKLMVESLIKADRNLEMNETISLKLIHPNSKKNPLDRPMVFKQTVNSQFKNRKETKIILAKDSDTYKEEVLNSDSKWYRWTVKDFGSFKRFLTDKRLFGLFQYFRETEIPFSILEHELKEYDKYREKFFDKIFDIEKAIVTKDKSGLMEIAKNRKHNEVSFKYYLQWMKKDNRVVFDEKLIRELRNGFSHSQFPSQDITLIPGITKVIQDDFDLKCETPKYKEGYNSISKQIYEKFIFESEKILIQINS